jgi:hypothetical protein
MRSEFALFLMVPKAWVVTWPVQQRFVWVLVPDEALRRWWVLIRMTI